MRGLFSILLCASMAVVPRVVTAQIEHQIPIIFDTDFVMPPTDDSMALMLALQSPEFEILGITTVASTLR